MNISFKTKPKNVDINSLDWGDTFIFGADVYIVTDKEDAYKQIKCVNLKTGYCGCFNTDKLVTPVECNLEVDYEI